MSKNEDINKGNLTVDINISGQCSYDDLIVLAEEAAWTHDMRLIQNVNFHQLNQYLVERTKKYCEHTMKGTVFKNERAYKEHHISDIKVTANKNLTLVRAKVIAYMKKIK
ncbi:hypothetical protein DPMN_055243 [Dreissena polymorpha]|uniref:Uncharacterized protein n=1 Tax=Dreissena polymorpha TaxID=45954 RepID=A0A9D4CSB8_DREPO|nr:hypothetical protein DPMN_055243 [Dreissena polymorpha]